MHDKNSIKFRDTATLTTVILTKIVHFSLTKIKLNIHKLLLYNDHSFFYLNYMIENRVDLYF